MIVSRQNPKLKSIRRLRHDRSDRALLEGPHLVGEAARLGLDFECLLATPDFLAGGAGRELAQRLPMTPLEVDPPLLRELSDVDAPQGILAVATLARRGADALPRREGGVYLYLEAVQDPGNLGAIARSAEAAGAAGLALAHGSVHPNHPRALRASAGSLLRLSVACDVSPEHVDLRLEGLAARWAALVPRGGTPLWEADLDGTVALAIGAEGPGLSPITRARCDLELTIPVEAPVESLNSAIAAAVALFELRRRR